MRRPDEVGLQDSREYPWLSRVPALSDIQEWKDPAGSPSFAVVGENRGKGSLLSISPVMASWSYGNREEFAAALNLPLLQAREAGLVDEQTVVVYPEHIGMLLYLADEFPWVTRAKTLEMAGLLASLDEKAWIFLTALRLAWEKPYLDAVRSELMRLKAPRAAEVYQSVFSSLAQTFGVAIVAGSLPLPSPEVRDGALTTGRGSHPIKDMAGVSALFRPDGSLDPALTFKHEPTLEESARLWMQPKRDAPHPLYETPAGRLGVLICADAWHPGPWSLIEGADLVAVPAMNTSPWNLPWEGYSMTGEAEGLPEPDGETLAEAWFRHAFPGRAAGSSAVAGASSFLKGRLFDITASGSPSAWSGGHAYGIHPSSGPQIVKVWRP